MKIQSQRIRELGNGLDAYEFVNIISSMTHCCCSMTHSMFQKQRKVWMIHAQTV